jgi:chromatin assembly factor 1 subunit A
MEDFKRAIDGSDMTKAGLIEQLKKAFPKVGKDNIKNTLELVAERVGEKRDDKRWVLK